MKKLIKILLISIILISSSNLTILAKDSYTLKFILNDYEVELRSFSSLDDALDSYNETSNIYSNLLLYKNDKLIKMKYGVVSFNNEDTCNINISYYSESTYTESYINGCYVSDGAYLYSSEDTSEVYFEVNGEIGFASIDDVILYPYLSNLSISNYMVKDGYLYHNIKSRMSSIIYRLSNKIDYAPSYLSANKQYYSYDSHYFYDDFYLMIDDYNNSTHDNSVNSDDPYYNYYQYLSVRSLTNYTNEEIENFFNNELLIDSRLTSYSDLNNDKANDKVNQSQLFGNYSAFFEYQNIYGTNALLLLSMACVDSAYGKSYNSFYKNDLFNKNAYDNTKETFNYSYDNIESSIYSFSRYLIGRYTNYQKRQYNGSYLGNKVSGLNASYSSDPYYGERVASVYFMIDSGLGLKDYNSKAIGVVNDSSLIIYSDEELNEQLFTVDASNAYSLILLENNDGSYKVQLDSTMDEYGTYDFASRVGYIAKDKVSSILNASNILEDKYYYITYDLGEGSIGKSNIVTAQYRLNEVPVINDVDNDSYYFEGFDTELEAVTEDKTYTAQYKKINSISVVTPFNDGLFIKDEGLNLNNGYFTITFEDNTSKAIAITTDNIRNYVDDNSDKEVTIEYRGLTTSQSYNLDEETTNANEKLINRVDSIISTYDSGKEISVDEINSLKEDLCENKIKLSTSQIETLDEIILNNYQDIKTVTYSNNRNVSIIGYGLSIEHAANPDPIDTYYCYIENSKKDFSAIEKFVDKFNLNVEDKINISFKFNVLDIESINQFEVKYEINDPNKIYTVYYYDDDGNIIKLNTTQTQNYITFIAPNNNDYIIMSSYSLNEYDINGDVNINNSLDYAKLAEILMPIMIEAAVIVVLIILQLRRSKKMNFELNNEYIKLNEKI